MSIGKFSPIKESVLKGLFFILDADYHGLITRIWEIYTT